MEFFQSSTFKAWVILPKVTGLMSIIGSCFILFDVLRKENRKQKLKITTNRIVTLMSICDVIFTFVGYFLGTWLVPKETGVFQAAGNQATCVFQGFVTHFFAGAATLLNATLAITYLLVVRYGWKDQRLQKPLMAFSLLAAPILISLGYHLWPLVDQAFNWEGAWMCTIRPSPAFCSVSPAPCVKGLHAEAIDYGAMIYVQICFALIFVSTVALYCTVLKKEMAMDRFAVDPSQVSRTYSKRVAWQGIWYAGSFLITWSVWWAGIVYEAARNEKRPTWVYTLQALLMPMQGFFNAIVYFRPRWANNRRTSSENRSLASRVSATTRRFWGIGSSLVSRESTKKSRNETQNTLPSSASARIDPSKRGSNTFSGSSSLDLVENKVALAEASDNEAEDIPAPGEIYKEKDGNTQAAEQG